MKKLLNDVAAFQAAYDAPCHPSRDSARTSGDLTPERVKLRLSLVVEEFFELLGAHGVKTQLPLEEVGAAISASNGGDGPYLKDMPEIADAIVDLIYVLVGMALEYGIPLDHVWEEVQSSNMRKFPGGKVLRRESDGKVMKPEGWTPPNVNGALLKVTAAGWHRPPSPPPENIREEVNRVTDERVNALRKQGLLPARVPSTESNLVRVDVLLDVLTERGF